MRTPDPLEDPIHGAPGAPPEPAASERKWDDITEPMLQLIGLDEPLDEPSVGAPLDDAEPRPPTPEEARALAEALRAEGEIDFDHAIVAAAEAPQSDHARALVAAIPARSRGEVPREKVAFAPGVRAHARPVRRDATSPPLAAPLVSTTTPEAAPRAPRSTLRPATPPGGATPAGASHDGASHVGASHAAASARLASSSPTNVTTLGVRALPDDALRPRRRWPWLIALLVVAVVAAAGLVRLGAFAAALGSLSFRNHETCAGAMSMTEAAALERVAEEPR